MRYGTEEWLVLQGPGGDRWQPPEVVNNNEVLVRPEPAEEDGQPDLQEEAVETQLAPAVVKTEQSTAVAEEESRLSHRYGAAVQQLSCLLAKARVVITPCEMQQSTPSTSQLLLSLSLWLRCLSTTLCQAK